MRPFDFSTFDLGVTSRDLSMTLYEATTDRVYGCGLSLFQRDRIGVNNPGQNKFGELLETVRRNLSGE